MPEYLHPGVYVEEVSYRARSIEGVGTSTTAFVGPTAKGPIMLATGATMPAGNTAVLSGNPEVITSFREFERVYGGVDDLVWGATTSTNYLAHAVRAFFDNGGSRLFIARAYTPNGGEGLAQSAVLLDDGGENIRIRARFPGRAYDGSVTIQLHARPAAAAVLAAAPVGSLARNADVIYIKQLAGTWVADDASELSPLTAGTELLSLNLSIDGSTTAYEDLGFTPSHPRYLGHALPVMPDRRGDALTAPYAVVATAGLTVTGYNLFAALFPDTATTHTIAISGGSDGAEPVATDNAAGTFSYADAFAVLEQIDDISITAAPGASSLNPTTAAAVDQALIGHCERMRYRVAVLDTPPNLTPGQASTMRGNLDSTRAALYYPWVMIANPLARPGAADIPAEIAVPPSGFVCGIYARNDVERGVHKAPANEVVRGALRFVTAINDAVQDTLNPIGVNCLRALPGRGLRIWGGRTISSDPEWKYVNVRRYFAYLERSIDLSTQWAVFEPNGEMLWANIRETVTAFLYNEWREHRLLGSNPEQAYFVRCDRSTMTQNDLDNGRLVCEIGVAALKPAEFVIFRIGQKTADADG